MAFWFLLTSWYQMLCWNAINILIQRDRTYLLAISWDFLLLKIRNQEKNIWEMTKSCSVLRKIYVHCFLWYLVFCYGGCCRWFFCFVLLLLLNASCETRGYTVEKNNRLPFPYMPMQMTNIAYMVVMTKTVF